MRRSLYRWCFGTGILGSLVAVGCQGPKSECACESGPYCHATPWWFSADPKQHEPPGTIEAPHIIPPPVPAPLPAELAPAPKPPDVPAPKPEEPKREAVTTIPVPPPAPDLPKVEVQPQEIVPVPKTDAAIISQSPPLAPPPMTLPPVEEKKPEPAPQPPPTVLPPPTTTKGKAPEAPAVLPTPTSIVLPPIGGGKVETQPPAAPIRQTGWVAEPPAPVAPPSIAKPTVITPAPAVDPPVRLYSHAADLHWVAGVVERGRLPNTWVLRYSKDDAADRHGGCVTLTLDEEEAHGLYNGKPIVVEGQLIDPQASGERPGYQAMSIKPLPSP